MLARLQQATTLGALLLAAWWAWACTRAGHPGWALAGALLIVGGYSVVLALEFALLHLAHGADPTPRATPAQLFRAWWGEVLSAPVVFCWRQPFFSQRWPDLLPAQAQGRRGVLLVHGFVCNRGLWNPWLKRLRQKYLLGFLSDAEHLLLQTLGIKYDKERKEEMAALRRLRKNNLRGKPLSEAEHIKLTRVLN
jgi:hypothetical protein